MATVLVEVLVDSEGSAGIGVIPGVVASVDVSSRTLVNGGCRVIGDEDGAMVVLDLRTVVADDGMRIGVVAAMVVAKVVVVVAVVVDVVVGLSVSQGSMYLVRRSEGLPGRRVAVGSSITTDVTKVQKDSNFSTNVALATETMTERCT